MKKTSRLLALVMALVLALGTFTTAMAEDSTGYALGDLTAGLLQGWSDAIWGHYATEFYNELMATTTQDEYNKVMDTHTTLVADKLISSMTDEQRADLFAHNVEVSAANGEALTASADGVAVNAPAGEFPSGTVANVAAVADETVLAALAEAIAAVDETAAIMSAYDISFNYTALGETKEVQPQNAVPLTFEVATADLSEDCTGLAVYHMVEDGNGGYAAELVGESELGEGDTQSVTVEGSAFSIYVTVGTQQLSGNYTIYAMNVNETITLYSNEGQNTNNRSWSYSLDASTYRNVSNNGTTVNGFTFVPDGREIEVTASTSGIIYLRYGNEDRGYDYITISAGPIKVYVYVAAQDSSGNSWLNNTEFKELIGLRVADGNGYFPAGEITLDPSFLTGKNYNTAGAALITNNPTDWTKLKASLSQMNTQTLVDGFNTDTANNPAAFSQNQGNKVSQYLPQAEEYYNAWWGSKHTALFRWHSQPYNSNSGYASLGFADQNVLFHLDLCFNTKKITFITGNNGITSGDAKDGTTVDSRVYITGSEIQEPRNLYIPDGYKFMGYYEDEEFTIPWNGIGTPLNEDETVYIKITPMANVIVNYVVAQGEGVVSVDNEAFNPKTGSPDGSTADPDDNYTFEGWYSDEACTQPVSTNATFVPSAPTGGWPEGATYTYYAKFVPAAGHLKITKNVTDELYTTAKEFTFTVKPDTADVDLFKAWAGNKGYDVNNEDNSITVKVTPATGTKSGECELNDMPLGQYTITEVDDDNAKPYHNEQPTQTATVVSNDTTTVTFTNVIEYVDVKVTKIWDDNNNSAALRPTSIVVNLSDGKTATLNDDNAWTFTWQNLPKYDNDHAEINYTVSEDKVTYYKTPVVALVTDAAVDYAYTITNTIDVSTLTIKKNVAKANGDTADLPDEPDSFTFTVELEANGNYSYTKTNADDSTETGTLEIKDGEGTITLKNGEEVKIAGIIIGSSYTVTEATSDADYYTIEDAEVEGEIEAGETSVAAFTNIYTKLKDGDLTITKTVKKSDFKGEATFSFNIALNGTDEVAAKQFKEWAVANSYGYSEETNTASVSIKVTADNLTKSLELTGLPVGNYTVTETAVAGYTTTYEPANGIVDVTAGETPVTVKVTNTATGTYETLEATKIWSDNSDALGYRPAEVELTLVGKVGNDTFDHEKQALTLNANNAYVEGGNTDSNKWVGSWTNVPMYDTNGNLITYTVTETAVPKYKEPVVTGDVTNGFTVTNSINVGHLKITKSGLAEGDSAIFNVKIDGSDYTTVVLTGGKDGAADSTMLIDLPEGAAYAVSEDPNWTKRYEIESSSGLTGKIPAGGTAEATIVNEYTPGKWLDDEGAAENVFTGPKSN